MPDVTNEDLRNIIKIMHTDIQARFGLLDTLVRKHEVKLAVIDHIMEAVEKMMDDLRAVTKDVQVLKGVTKQHSANWEKVWNYVVGVVLTAAVVALLGLVFIM